MLGIESEEALNTAVATLGPLPSLTDIDAAAVQSHIGRDKKKKAAGIGWVLPTDDGVVLDQQVTFEEAIEVFQELEKTSIFRD